jgi:probable sporulation protein (polysaccharide deacetylase family)
LKINHTGYQKKIILFFSFLFVLWAVFQSTNINQYVVSLKSQDYVAVDSAQEDLKRKIKEIAKEKYKAPIDSRIDPVWKGIPGYNGIQVDLETSYRVAEQLGIVEEKNLIYEEIPIEVGLDDLGAVPIYRGNPEKPLVSLMINVAWGTEHLNEMLETLAKEKVLATFFFDGSWLKDHPEMARKIQRAGHEIGNHAYSHPMMSHLSNTRAVEEIRKTEELIRHYLGISSKLFAPPSGDFNQSTVDAAHKMGLKTILWTLDTVDWKKPAPEAIIQRIIPNIDNGALVLMHPTEPTKKALPKLIQEIKRKGLRLGTVSENFSPKRLPNVEPGL